GADRGRSARPLRPQGRAARPRPGGVRLEAPLPPLQQPPRAGQDALELGLRLSHPLHLGLAVLERPPELRPERLELVLPQRIGAHEAPAAYGSCMAALSSAPDRGRPTRKVLPAPGDEDTVRVPPSSSTSRREIGSPRPVPSPSWSWSWTNSSKIRSWSGPE